MINATKKSFSVPSNKPVDVEYRLKRLRATLAEAQMFLNAIDPSVFPEQHEAVASALETLAADVAKLKAPAKKARKSAEEKAAEAAAKALAKEEASKARAAEKAAKSAAKAKSSKEAA